MKNRVIKFRAWLRTGFDDNDEEFYEMVYHLAFEDYEPINDLLNGVEHLMQYTGLDDVNGKEIYEGDVVKLVGGVCVIRFANGGWVAQNIPPEDGRDWAIQPHHWTDTVIIGNIYESQVGESPTWGDLVRAGLVPQEATNAL